MIDVYKMIQKEIDNGYNDANAQAKVCQDLILKAISLSSLNRNVTIKGGVVMRSKTRNIRRATQDIDLDFIRYSLSNEAIDAFIDKINCLEGIVISRTGEIRDLKQQDYHGKRIYLQISDSQGFSMKTKLDVGVHNRIDIEQEEYCFEIAYDSEGASLLVNTGEQMIVEKLRSLLILGPFSTRYKDVFDLYFLCRNIDRGKLGEYLNSCIFLDRRMRERNIHEVSERIHSVFRNERFRHNLASKEANWSGENVDEVLRAIQDFLDTF